MSESSQDQIAISVLEDNPPVSDVLSALIADLDRAGFQAPSELAQRFLASLLTKRFVILTGVTGSGKTKLAQVVATWFSQRIQPSERDAEHEHSVARHAESAPTATWLPVGQEIRSDRVLYRVDAIDTLAVQFSSERERDQRVKVTLPKGLIEEWVTAIQRFGYSRTTPARTIRETVARSTTYSTQLNSFETHLKAAAFAMIELHEGDEHEDEYSVPDPEAQADVGAVPVASADRPDQGSTYRIVAVGADWNSSESILGYPDALQPTSYVRTPTLDLILAAHANPRSPCFLILDEMNLSHVERYFSDILSSMESGEPIHLYSASGNGEVELRDGVPPSICLPDNLFIIGTVNVDETTYMFSPKVLDRANTIEFRVSASALEAFLASPKPIDLDSLSGRGERFVLSFLNAARGAPTPGLEDSQARVNAEIELFFTAMADHGSEFGFRTAMEMSRFIGHFQRLKPETDGLDQAVDAQIYQKILPRLSGSRAQLEPVLRSLLALCRHQRHWEFDEDGVLTLANRASILAASRAASDSPLDLLDPKSDVAQVGGAGHRTYPLAEAKILRMLQLLRQNGFTSFAEA